MCGASDFNERHDLTVHVRASRLPLRPDEPGPPFQARQIKDFNIQIVVTPHRASADRTRPSLGGSGDRDSRPSRPITNTFDIGVGQADQQFAHARRIDLQQGFLETVEVSYESETIWRIPRDLTRSEVGSQLDDLPCPTFAALRTADDVALSFRAVPRPEFACKRLRVGRWIPLNHHQAARWPPAHLRFRSATRPVRT